MTIIPEGEAIRKAIQWMSEERETRPDEKTSVLISEAGLRFDLQPNEEEFLFRFFTEENPSSRHP